MGTSARTLAEVVADGATRASVADGIAAALVGAAPGASGEGDPVADGGPDGDSVADGGPDGPTGASGKGDPVTDGGPDEDSVAGGGAVADAGAVNDGASPEGGAAAARAVLRSSRRGAGPSCGLPAVRPAGAAETLASGSDVDVGAGVDVGADADAAGSP